jgi:dephospho-CoA kinase
MYLSTQYGFQYLRYSQVLAEWFPEKLGTPGALQATGWEIMRTQQEELNRRLIAKIEPDRDIATDGLRHPIDERALRAAFGRQFFLLYVDAPVELRWQRKRDAQRFEAFDAFAAADVHAVEKPQLLLRDHATSVIQNIGSLSEYYAMLRANLERIESGALGDQS